MPSASLSSSVSSGVVVVIRKFLLVLVVGLLMVSAVTALPDCSTETDCVEEVWNYTGLTAFGKAVSVDNDGNVYSGGEDTTVRKLNSSGDLQWTFTGHSHYLKEIVVDEENNTYSVGGFSTAIKKVNSSGSQLWSKSYEDTLDTVEHYGDYIYVGGVLTGSDTGFVAKIDRDTNNVVWRDTSFSDQVRGVGVDSDGNVYAGSNIDKKLKKFDSSGNQQWSLTLSNNIAEVDVDDEGYVYVATLDDYKVRKFHPNSSLIWEFTGHTDKVFDVEVDNEGYVYTTGYDNTVRKLNDKTYPMTETNTAPDSPSNPSPADGATNIGSSPTLSVDVTDPDGDSMDVTFYDASDDSVIGNDTGVANGTSATVTWNGLSQGTTYEWYANVSDGEYTNVSSTYDFTTGSAPNTPTNPSPADGATGQATSLTLSIDVSDPNGDTMDVTFYDASDDSVIDTDSNVADGGTASVSWSNLEQLTTYEWYATADDGGYGTNSSTYDFTTADVNDAPDEPTNPSPADGAAGVPVNATLSVYVYDEDGDNLDVLFFDSSDDSLIGSTNVASGTDATANWTGLSVYTTYGWYATVDDGEFSDTSVMFDFTTGGLDAEEPVEEEEEEEVVASPVTNSSTVMGKALNGLVTGIFGSETVVALFLLVLLLGVGALFGLVFQIILIALVPVTVVLYASGWLPGAIAFPLLLFIGVIVAFNFFNRR